MLDDPPRTYRVMDLLANGVVVLNAIDQEAQHRRRLMPIADLPAGAATDSFIVVAKGCATLTECDDDSATMTNSTISLILRAAVQTIADALQVPPSVAARLCDLWLQEEIPFATDNQS